MIVTLHSKTLFSSTNPAENPSTGFLESSAKSKSTKKKTNSIKNSKRKSKPSRFNLLNKKYNFVVETVDL